MPQKYNIDYQAVGYASSICMTDSKNLHDHLHDRFKKHPEPRYYQRGGYANGYAHNQIWSCCAYTPVYMGVYA